MNLRVILIIIGILFHPAVSIWAQQDVLRFHNVSVADALTTINEHYPNNSIHFVRNELDTLKISSLMLKGVDVLDDITRIIGKYPVGIKIFGNHIFVEYKHEKKVLGNLMLMPVVEDEDIAYSRILHEVMVSQTFPMLGLEGAVLSLRIANTPLALAGSASDLLTYLPGVQLGVSGTVIRIDGKPVTSYNELNELSSEEVDYIDYSDQPQFSSRQHFIIDIRTHRKREDGYGIHMASQYSQGEKGRAMQMVKTNIHQGRWDLQLSGAYRYDGIDKDLTINKVWFSDDYDQNSFHLSIGSEYRLGRHATLGLQYRFLSMLNSIRQKRANLIFDFDSSNSWFGVLLQETTSQNLQRIRDWQLDYLPQHDASVYLKASWRAWDVNTAASFYHDGVNLSELDVTGLLLHEHSSNDVLNTLWAVKTDAQRPLWHGRLHLMAEYSHTGRDDVYHRQTIGSVTTNYLRRQNRWSGSLSYRRQVNKVEGAMGVLAEAVDTYPDFPFVFPFADVCLIGHRSRLSLSYAMRSSMPTYGQTNGFAYHNIEMLGIEGEPDLRPSLEHHLQLKALVGSFYGSIGWQRVSDYIVQSIERRDQDELVASYHNLDVANLFSASLNYHYSLHQWNSQYVASIYSQRLNDGQRKFVQPVVRLQWNNQVQLPYGITALLNAVYHTSGHEGATWQQQSGQVDFALVKETRNWTLQLRAEDLLHTATTRTIYYGKDALYNRRCYADHQRIQLTFRINLGSLSRQSLRSLNAGSSERERL